MDESSTNYAPITFDWVTIPAGEFLMGSDKATDKDAYEDELPQHKLYLPEYKIARGPVTVAQFAQFVSTTGYKTTAEQQGSAWDWAKQAGQWLEIKGAYWAAPRGAGSHVHSKQNHPVTCVSWHDAQKFCAWAGVRLPSEAEWEKAARGSSTGSETGRIYPWGNEAPDQSRCNFSMNVQDTTAIDHYPPSANGLLDMAGNVREWTSSLWGKDEDKPEFGYPYQAGDGRENQHAGDDICRVVRGGSFVHTLQDMRCARRGWFFPDYLFTYFGFRVLALGG